MQNINYSLFEFGTGMIKTVLAMQKLVLAIR